MSSPANKKQKLALSIREKYVSAVSSDEASQKYVSDPRLLSSLKCYQTTDTFHHTFKTFVTDDGECVHTTELDIDIAICYFPLTHAYDYSCCAQGCGRGGEHATTDHNMDNIAEERRHNNGPFFVEFDLLFHKESVTKILNLYGASSQQSQFEKMQECPKYSCLVHSHHTNYIHYRDLISYLHEYKLPVDTIHLGKHFQTATAAKEYEKLKQDGSKTTKGVPELMEALGLAESLTRIYRRHWQQVRPDQLGIHQLLKGGQGLFESGDPTSMGNQKNQIAQLESVLLQQLPLKRLMENLSKQITLQSHQHFGIRWMYLREKIPYFGVSGGILADDMGLGKTLQSLSLIVMEPNCCCLKASINLVICKLSVLHQWKDEAKKFFPGTAALDVFIFYNSDNSASSWEEIIESTEESDDRATIVLTTYDQIREKYHKQSMKTPSAFMEHTFHRVICDEGHQIANATSSTALAISSLKACHRWILSGSPYRNSPRDLYSLAVQFLRLQDSFLDEERFGRKARWNRAFTRMDATRDFEESGVVPKFNLSPSSIRDEARVESWLNVLMLRRMQSDQEAQLPERIHHEHTCAFERGSHEEAIYEHVRSAVENFVLNIFDSGESFNFTSVHGGVMLLRRICVSIDLLLKDESDSTAMWTAKAGKRDDDGPIRHLTKHHVLQALPRNLKTFLGEHKQDKTKLTSKISLVKLCLDKIIADAKREDLTASKVVVFSQWSGVLDIAEQLLEMFFANKFSILRIDGATSGKARASQCSSFNNDRNISYVLLLNYKAAGEGLNLQRGQHLLLVDPWFTPSVEDQAIARVYRQGNKNKRVHIHRFVIANSIEQRVQQISDRKRSESKRLLSMGLEHRSRMVQNTMDLSRNAILELLGDKPK